MHHRKSRLYALSLLCLAATAAPAALGHGDVDEAVLVEFHLHLDDFQEEVRALIDDLDGVLAARSTGGDAGAAVAERIDHWEAVAVHGAVERHAMALYPGIWQALITLQQQAGGTAADSELRAAAEEVEASLWQGLGAVRLAASQAGAEAAPPVGGGDPLAGPEVVDAIIAELEAAVAAYGMDDLGKAESLLHSAYMNRFEGLEGDLIARDPELVSQLEQDFNATLPLQMQRGAGLDEVNGTLQSMKRRLETASDILEQVAASRAPVF